ncbi:ACOT9 [Mytilus edulis]|uniref:ACOT9 n=1 Tax=Mytilus edulis TaxID=6550 RepID=A0A8S3TKQ2_MYTED|nr:ACOT9 [Mytilus edulis]
MRFGRILEDLDTFAVLISYTHSTQGTEKKSPISIVTALVDRIELGEKPFSPFKDIKMKGSVTWAGKTSMEITMNLEQEDASEWKKVLTARFVMVARNPLTKKSAFINALQLTSQEEEKIFELGEVNKVKRQGEAKRNLLKTPPHENEIQIVHEHFLKTLDPSSSTFKIRVKPENSVWMDQTKLKNLIICFPEQRNLYNKIFGGYLMRKAFELAWTSAALYSKSRQVAITTVDDIVFRKPVEIGSLLFLSSEVSQQKNISEGRIIGDIPEDDVYVCESKYQEPEKTIKKLGKGLKINSSQLYGIKTTESFIDEDSRSMDTSISSVFESFTPQPEKQQMSSSSKKKCSEGT